MFCGCQVNLNLEAVRFDSVNKDCFAFESPSVNTAFYAKCPFGYTKYGQRNNSCQCVCMKWSRDD